MFAAAYAVFSAERYFSSTGFCLSCHSMSYPYEALKRSRHYGTLGINPECRDCHFPPWFPQKVKTHIVEGVRDIISEFRYDLGTKEAFDAHREEFAARARESIRSWDSASCRTCHKAPKPSTEFGRAAHASMKSGKATCVDCHRNIFHV
ncbi:MAG: NapC/NirT family cytochrome c [Deltaproteobacteria bacterium]|nr:NapC/NirT family cytochrome c [Deltaproteobacteria bacterium]